MQGYAGSRIPSFATPFRNMASRPPPIPLSQSEVDLASVEQRVNSAQLDASPLSTPRNSGPSLSGGTTAHLLVSSAQLALQVVRLLHSAGQA